MNNSLRLLAVAGLVVGSQFAQAQMSSNVVGYNNFIFAPGSTLFAFPFEGEPNDLANQFFLPPPTGTTISQWHPETLSFTVATTYDGSAWSDNLTIIPGLGYRLDTTTSFVNTFIGLVRNHDGNHNIPGDFTTPPLYTGPNGVFLLGDKTAIADTGTDIFLNILGRPPLVGEQVITLLGGTTYLGNSSWSSGTPILKIGEAAFLNIGPVPEPTTMSLTGLALALGFLLRRHWQKHFLHSNPWL